MKEVHQYGDKSVYVEQHTGNIIIQHPGGAIVLDPNTAEGIEQLRQELGAQMERILDLLKHPAGNKPPRHLTNPPFDAAFFIGREADLETIEATYQQHSRLLMLVNGEGGIGKTTLAAKYWHAHAERYRHLAWLYADAGIGSALLSLQEQLDVEFGPQDSFETQVQRIAVALNNLDAPCLLVFDNANDAADLRQHYTLLHRLNTCHILLTSRVRNARAMQVHEVQPLSESDALRLFRHYYPGIDEAELPMLQAILHAVGLNTLVIELLAKNLALLNRFALRYSLAEMLADLQGKGLLALKSKTVELVYGSDTLRSAEPGEVIAAMYDLAKLDEAACHLLSNLAVLPAENLPYDLLARLLDTDPEALETSLSSLEEAGWIEYRSADSSFKISPVVQEVTRYKHAARLLQDCRTLIRTLTAGLDEDNRHQDNYRQAAVYARLGEAVTAVLPADDDVATLCQNIGNYHQDTGNLSLSLRAYEAMHSIQAALCTAEPDNANFKNSLAVSYSKLGDTHSNLGNLPQALAFFEQRSRLGKELHEAYPANVSFKNGLAISYSKLGSTHSNLGNLPQALAFFEQETQLFEELHEAYPANVSFKRGLAISYSNLGETHSNLGNLPQALALFEQYNQLSKELHEAYPENVSFKQGLAISYEKLGDTHSNLGNLPQALALFEQGTQLFEELHEAFPANVSFQNGLAISYSKLGDTHSALGNLPQALAFFEQDIKLSKELHEAYPSNVSFQNGLAISYYKLGQLHEQQGDLEKAFEYFKQDLHMTELAYQNSPNHAQFKENLKISYQNMGDISSKMGKTELAETYYQQAQALGEGGKE